MLGRAMKKVVDTLEKKEVDLSAMRALDIFAREGDWQTIVYSGKAKSLEAWEIDRKYRKGLRKNVPNAKIRTVDYIEEISKKKHFGKFDFMVADNPQNCYGPDRKYCEHFEVIPKVARLLDGKGVIIFNINKEPFDFDKFPKWQKRREKFYGRKDTSRLSVKWLLNFYKKLFRDYGYKTENCFRVIRGTKEKNNYLQYLIYLLKKK